MSDDVMKFRDAIRESKSRVIMMRFKQKTHDPLTNVWKNIDESIAKEHVEQRRYSFKLSIADSTFRTREYQRQRDTRKVLSKEWNELNNLMRLEVDMQQRLTVELNAIK
jgi:hypothetical protein